MRKARREILVTMASATAALAIPLTSRAAAERTLRVTVGFPAGDMADTIARVVSERLRGTYASTVLVDNKPGAAGRLALGSFASYRNDGTEAIFTPGAAVVLFPHVFQKLPYHPLRDLKPVAKIASFYLGLAVGPAVPGDVKTLDQYLSWVRKDSRNASYATSGAGTNIHLATEYLAHLSKTPLSMVPYRGASLALTDLIAGQVPAQVATIPSLVEHARTGRIRILAVSSPERLSVLPEVATFKEQGFPQLVVDGWFGAFLPGGTRDESAASLNEAIQRALKDQVAIASLEKMGLALTATREPTEFAGLISQEYQRWSDIARQTGFKPIA